MTRSGPPRPTPGSSSPSITTLVLFSPAFGPFDAPRVTHGNIGLLVWWLRWRLPEVPAAWTVQLTEAGISSAGPTFREEAQAPAIRASLRQALGTPGIESSIHHRKKDHPAEGGRRSAWRGRTAASSPPGPPGRWPTAMTWTRRSSPEASRICPTPA